MGHEPFESSLNRLTVQNRRSKRGAQHAQFTVAFVDQFHGSRQSGGTCDIGIALQPGQGKRQQNKILRDGVVQTARKISAPGDLRIQKLKKKFRCGCRVRQMQADIVFCFD